MQEPGPSKSGNLTRPTKKVIHYFLAKNITLNEAENAWVPNCKRGKDEQQSSDDVDAQIEKTKNSVRSLMNKITQDNMDTITEKIMSLPINTYACLTSITELVFEKAIAEPGFAPQYAGLCQAMQDVKVLSNDGNMKESFKSLLLSTCQKTFNQMNENERKAEKLLLDIESCQDMETKKRLGMKYEETEHNNRRRSVGNSRFMCELFKVKILKQRMLKKCINHLSNSRKEEQLECLCNILKNVGRNLDLTTTFQKLEELLLVKNRNIIPTRIRFMIMDTIDLKNNGWLSRNADKMLSSPQQESGPSNYDYSTTGTRKEVTQDSLSNESMTLPMTENTLVTKCKVPIDEHQTADRNDTISTVEYTNQQTSTMKENSNIQTENLGTVEKQKNNAFSWDQTNTKFDSKIIKKYNAVQKDRQFIDRKDKCPTVDHIYQPTQQSRPSNYDYSTTGTRREVTKDSLSNESMTLPMTENTLVTKCKVPIDEHQTADRNDTISTVEYTNQQTSKMKENSNIQTENLGTVEKQKNNAFSWDQTNTKFESKIIKKYNVFEKERIYRDKKNKSPTVDYIYQPTNYNAFTWNQTNHKFESKIIKKYNPFQKESHYKDKKDKSPSVDYIYQPTDYNAFTWNQTNHKFESKIIKYNPFQKESHYIDKKDKSPTVDHIYQPTQESGPSNYEYSTTVTRKKVTQDSLSNESMTLPMTENTWVTKCKVAKDEHQSADMNNIKPTFEYAYQPTSSMNKNSNIQPKILETAEKQSINTDKDLIRTSEDQKFNISDFFYPLINTILQICILWCKN